MMKCTNKHEFKESEADCLGVMFDCLILFNCPVCKTTVTRPLSELELKMKQSDLMSQFKRIKS